jgi:hypothetical protein
MCRNDMVSPLLGFLFPTPRRNMDNFFPSVALVFLTNKALLQGPPKPPEWRQCGPTLVHFGNAP